MKELLISNWPAILATIVLVLFVAYLIITKQWKTYAYELMLQAERTYASDEGKKKFDAVFNCLYNKLVPQQFRLFITVEFVRSKLQKWYNTAKKKTLN